MKKKRKPKKFLKDSYSKFLRKSSVWIFNLFIVQRDKRCVNCGTTDNLTCGHFVSALCAILRYNEINCNCQCATCNYKHEFDPLPYSLRMIDHYWVEKLEELKDKRGTSYKRSITELENICDKYWDILLWKEIPEIKKAKIRMILKRIAEYNESIGLNR